MSVWDTPLSECTSEELERNFHWFYEGEGGRGMKDLILHDRICTELETRGYEIRAVPEAQTFALFKPTKGGGQHGE